MLSMLNSLSILILILMLRIVAAFGSLFMLDVLSLWLDSIEAPPTGFTKLDTQLVNEWRTSC
jgi:hypothetical protein